MGDHKKKEIKSKNAEPNRTEQTPMDTTNELDDSTSHNYHDDSDFDEAFKNLLRPIALINKKNHCQPLQYDLLKELDSYLNHLRDSSIGGSSVFVEAALMIQNVILIYQKRVDQVVDVMMNLIRKFRAYRMNKNIDEIENGEGENVTVNKKKPREKKVKFYPSFEPITELFDKPIQNNINYRDININKKSTLPRIVLNANIKVENKYSQILPYICIGNGETLGKKYDFMLSYPLNRNLAVNEEFDCPTNINKDNTTTLKYRKSTVPETVNVMEVVVDEGISDEMCPSSPNSVNFDQMDTDEVYVANAMLPKPNATNILNVSQIPPEVKKDLWNDTDHTPTKDKNNISEKPIGNARMNSKKEDDGPIWLPSYTIGELKNQLMLLKMGLPVSSAFRQKIRIIYLVQKSEAAKTKIKRIIEEEKEKFDYHDEEMENKLKSGDEPGFRGFNSPIHTDGFEENVAMDIFDEQIEEANQGNFVSYQDIQKNMEKHERNQQEIVNEQALMLKRVQQWHDNLRPILKEEEKRTDFDIHEYGTRLLNCFESIGEQKTFNELIEGLAEEEVSRYFLSTLMMTNTYNLKLSKSIDGEMIIELLKKERHHEELQVNIGNQVNQEPH